jgi:hypothetical protein
MKTLRESFILVKDRRKNCSFFFMLYRLFIESKFLIFPAESLWARQKQKTFKKSTQCMLAQVLQRWWVNIPFKSEWNYSVKSVLHSTELATILLGKICLHTIEPESISCHSRGRLNRPNTATMVLVRFLNLHDQRRRVLFLNFRHSSS